MTGPDNELPFLASPRDAYRVGMTPMAARELVGRGHEVTVETHAGDGCGFSDDDYREAGANVVDTAAEIFDKAELVVKVKEPQLSECAMPS